MKRPNVLIFMTDHQRGDMAPPYKRAITPNMDKIASSGITFSNIFCTAPHCCPTRASFYSGLYPSQHGVWNNVNVANRLSSGLNDGIKLWSEDLKDAGYKMYFTGKWHVSADETPTDRGWIMTNNARGQKRSEGQKSPLKPYKQEWLSYSSRPENLDSSISGETHREEGRILRPGYPAYRLYGEKENPFNDSTIVDIAVKSINEMEDDGTPWCHYVGTLGPHDPYFVPQEFIDMYDINDIELPETFYDNLENKPNLYKRTRKGFDQLTENEHKEGIRHYLAFCTYEDFLFGKVLKAVEDRGEIDNTIIIYTSDHGDYAADHGFWAKGLPCFKGAYHIPMIISWPKGIVNPGRDITRMVSQVDFAPTLLDMLGIDAGRSFAGTSLMPMLKNQDNADFPPEEIYTQSNGNEVYGIQRSVMTRDFKFVYNAFDFDELYDLRKDPDEIVNVVDDPNYSDVIKSMYRKIWQFAYDHEDTCVNQYIMVSLATYGPGIIFHDDKD